ncbi:MAG TPA: hypothetical protein PLF88_12125 [Opitutaceae bacterium]|nr:hypothetical protein [Opitutaceae bacterium]HRJ47527.1 hypothetical protein [Opitutaceae bacterium]
MSKPACAIPVRAATPCCCCRQEPHAGIPDRDLQGYLCADCAHCLRAAEAVLKAAGLADDHQTQP